MTVRARLTGSPPHSRGRPQARWVLQQTDRLTPAFAGKTAPDCGGRPHVRAHPRIRGEDHVEGERTADLAGSPPHSRGRQQSPSQYQAGTGLTPAFAGKTRILGAQRAGNRAHPRIRGEDPDVGGAEPEASGSPPHSRGRLAVKASDQITIGLTPAFAGKTVWRGALFCVFGAHPRIRGED